MPRMNKKSPKTKAEQKKLYQADRRANEQFRQEEQEANTLAHRLARQNPDFHDTEQVRNTDAHRRVRQDPELRDAEQGRNTRAHRLAREDPEFRALEQQRDANAHRLAREDAEFRTSEQRRNTNAHRLARENPEFREIEQEKNTVAHRLARLDPHFREREQVRDAAAHRSTRENSEVREAERDRNRRARKATRSDVDIRTPEKSADREYRSTRRTDPVKRKLDDQLAATSMAKRRKCVQNKEFDELASDFNNEIRKSASYVCVCCGRLEYQQNLKQIPKSSFKNTVICVKDFPEQFCNTCHRSIKAKKVPKLCLKNGLDFPEIPSALQDLSPLEERLLALRIPYMQIRAHGFIRQLKIKGAVVNIENDLMVTTKWVPRNFNETSTIQVDLMRRMQSKYPYMSENVRPQKIMQAARYLVEQPLYKRHGVVLNTKWKHSTADKIPFVTYESEIDTDNSSSSCEFLDSVSDHNAVNDSDHDSDDASIYKDNDESDESLEDNSTVNLTNHPGLILSDLSSDEEENTTETDDQYFTAGAAESLIFSGADLTAIRIAPGEGKKPIPLYSDQYVEEMSFPRTYGGQFRVVNPELGISYTDIKKSELLRYDRRACRPTQILFAFRMSFENQLHSAIQIFLRKKKGGEKYTAAQARHVNFVDSLAHNNEGYAIWKNVRCTPPYWQSQIKKAMAMLRQFGKFTFFITLSSGETVWPELLVMLHKSQKNEDITEDDAMLLSNDAKADLIRNDPVMCTRHFYHRYNKLRTLIFKRENGIFEDHKVTDHFGRVEYQMRGAPHIHEMLYLKDAPEFTQGDAESERNCVEFIDKFITVEKDESDEMKHLIKRQLHNHSHTCHKNVKNQRECRFGYPIPPLPRTMLLAPLEKELNIKEKERLQEIFQKVKTDLRRPERRHADSINSPSFYEYINSFQPPIDMEDYILALRSSISRLTVFHKREVNAAYVNRYNKELLKLWQANLDIQFVTDFYACANYCLSYMCKTDGGMSQLMRLASKEVRKGNLELREQIKIHAKVLNNGTEIGPQEASAFMIGLPQTDCSRSDVFVNTGRPDERTAMLKSKKDLEDLPDSSTDILEKGLVFRYTQRPNDEEFNDMCLAEFATSYNFKLNKQHSEECDDQEDADTQQDNVNKNKGVGLLDESGFITRRSQSHTKILRFRNFQKSEDPNNYWREQLMLFTPWRDEEEELLKVNAQTVAELKIQTILENSKPFYFNREVTDLTIRDLMTEVADEVEDPELRRYIHSEEDEEEVLDTLVDSVPRNVSVVRFEQFFPSPLIPDEEYFKNMRDLNLDQRKFVIQTLNKIKCNETFYYFLHGGAGVGKSHCIKAIVQSILRYSQFLSNIDPTKVQVVVTASTGKAAFCVQGMTLHCCFNLPRNSYEGNVLTESALNSLRSRLLGLKLIIIDEISMVSVKHLYQIDHRLRQIFNTNEDFGGRSVLVVGHLRQLSPVGGNYVFDIPRHLNRGYLGGNHLWDLFTFFELNEIMRQRGQHHFCKALNNLSEGCMDDEDVELMRSRTTDKTEPPPFDAIHLFYTNKECEAHNQKVHSQLDTQGVLSIACDNVEGMGTEERRIALLERAKLLPASDCEGLRFETFLKAEGQYFVSTNIDVSDGLFNGATGVLKYIEEDPKKDNQPIRAWMHFADKSVGKNMRKICRGSVDKMKTEKGPMFETLTPIPRITRKLFKNKPGQGLTLIRSQIPLVACNGMTITKSQGSTLDTVVVCTKRKLRIQDLYVACSRVTSIEGLYIDGPFYPPKLPGPAKDAPVGETRDLVTIALEQLRQKQIEFEIKFFSDFPLESAKIYFQNIRSFRKYFKDLESDINATSADVVVLVEPKLVPQDSADLKGYTLCYRLDCRNNRNSEGVLLFSKDKFSRNVRGTAFSQTYSSDSGHCIFLIFDIPKLTVMAIYKSPDYAKRKFLDELERRLKSATSTSPLVVVGDCNFDLTDPKFEFIGQMFAKYGFRNLLDVRKPTTNYGSHLDICFANLPQSDAFISEAYYSDHKGIGIVSSL